MRKNSGEWLGRKQKQNRKIRRILILCEDSKSSRDYFEQFPYDPEQVEILCEGKGMNTASLMEEAIRRAEKARTELSPYERVWVVFDKDDFPVHNFNRAIDLSRKHREIAPCWSNECFELWYLLHFSYIDSGINRRVILRKLSKCIDKEYEKADASLHRLLLGKLDKAIIHAKKLFFENEKNNTSTSNPSTRVHELVGALLELDPKKQK